MTTSGDLETTRACVDRLLSSDEEDLQVDLVGGWQTLADDRRDVLADPLADLHLVRELYRNEPRVRLVDAEPESVFPAAFRLDVPVTVGVGRATVRRLLAGATRHELGVLHALAPGHGRADAVSLTRTAAAERARRQLGATDDHALGAVWGLRWVDGAVLGIVDLRVPRHRDRNVRWGRDRSRLQRRIRSQRRKIRRLRNEVRALTSSRASSRRTRRLRLRPGSSTD